MLWMNEYWHWDIGPLRHWGIAGSRLWALRGCAIRSDTSSKNHSRNPNQNQIQRSRRGRKMWKIDLHINFCCFQQAICKLIIIIIIIIQNNEGSSGSGEKSTFYSDIIIYSRRFEIRRWFRGRAERCVNNAATWTGRVGSVGWPPLLCLNI